MDKNTNFFSQSGEKKKISKIFEIFGFSFASLVFFSILFFSTYKSFGSYKISVTIMISILALMITAECIIEKFGKWNV